MGNKLSCSCGPVKIKGYSIDPGGEPWDPQVNPGIMRRGRSAGPSLNIPICRLWAEVFHVTTSNSGTVKWTQVSEDLVPVNITCVQELPEVIFHITAYNSQVEKILDVRLLQPGTKIGQASECFVYWRDTSKNDTWGLNFTSPVDAKQFRDCCDASRLQSRIRYTQKNSSRSTPTSPSRSREPQCTCMTPEQVSSMRSQRNSRIRASTPCGMSGSSSRDNGYGHSSSKRKQSSQSTPSSPTRLRKAQCTCAAPDPSMQQLQQQQFQGQNGRGNLKGSHTLPRNLSNNSHSEAMRNERNQGQNPGDSHSYNAQNVNSNKMQGRSNGPDGIRSNEGGFGIMRDRDGVNDELSLSYQPGGTDSSADYNDTRHNNNVKVMRKQSSLKSTRAGAGQVRNQQLQHNEHYASRGAGKGRAGPRENSRNLSQPDGRRKIRSRSTDHLNHSGKENIDSGTLKKMLKPFKNSGRIESPLTSPEARGNIRNGNRSSNTRGRQGDRGTNHLYKYNSDRDMGFSSEPEASSQHQSSIDKGNPNNMRGSNDQNSCWDQYVQRRRIDAGGCGTQNNGELYLDFPDKLNGSPPSDSGGIFDCTNNAFATTPSSSNGNSDIEGPASPTSQLLMEYEEHLRNTLEKGLDAESFSLHTFEALLSRSMENLEQDLHELGPGLNPRSTYLKRKERERDRSRTMPSRFDPSGKLLHHHQGRGGPPEKFVTKRGGAIPNAKQFVGGRPPSLLRPQSVNSSYESTGMQQRMSPAYSSMDHSGYLSDRTDQRKQIGGPSGFGRGGNVANRGNYIGRGRDSGMKDNLMQTKRLNGYAPTNVRSDALRSGYMSDQENRAKMFQQISVESAQSQDSRLCYLTSSEISDDDRMSLTTAISDDDEIDENMQNSSYKMKPSGSAASFNCTGAVRKAGFLSVKKWILRKKHQVELARKRGWKGYWVCLKGTTLLFYPCDSREGRSVEATPKHLIIVDGAIMQAIPEHPKRDYIFCLSTAFGDAYLFQAPCQVELETWVNSIHSACAAAFARHRGKTGTLHLLQEEIYRLEKGIESDQKLKHMAELQLSVVSDAESKRQIENQIQQWDENLERICCEQFRLRCYMASLQNGELPNPKGVLTQVTPMTKGILNRLGVFTVSSFHAFICARSPSLLNNLLAGRGATKRRAPHLSRSNSASSRRSFTTSLNMEHEPSKMLDRNGKLEQYMEIVLPENKITRINVMDGMNADELLTIVALKEGLNPAEYFVRIKKRKDMPTTKYFVPHRTDLIDTYLHTHEVIEICAKILYQVELCRGHLEIMWGFSVEAELVENSERQDELCCYVSRVEERSIAMNNGVIKGDEIMVLNGAIVSDLDMMFLESVLQEEISLCMMMRSARTEAPDCITTLKNATDDIIDSLVCPPPPSDREAINEDVISSLIVPAPGLNKEAVSPDGDSTTAPPSQASEHSEANSKQSNNGRPHPIDAALEMANNKMKIQSEQLLTATGKSHNGDTVPKSHPNKQATSAAESSYINGNEVNIDDASSMRNKLESPTGSYDSNNSNANDVPGQISSMDITRMKKVICELVETERAYVDNLSSMIKLYFQPLQEESFLSKTEVLSLFGNIQDIYSFQQRFLQSLEDAIDGDLDSLNTSMQLKSVLLSIASAFIYYAEHFKLYSLFCASHSKAQKALHPTEGNQALQDFLMSCNKKKQQSTSLESYLIKPIQRILKYPLLLQQLKNAASANSEEQQHLFDALIGMERVAEHINEMQRIHEEYGAIFDHLFRQHQKASKSEVDLSPGDLLYYGGVEWLNISDFLGKIKKGLELHAMCFVFRTAVVFLCKERLRQKKKSIMGAGNKSAGAEVEIIRYQVLIPVVEVQVRPGGLQDVESHFLWELIHLKSQMQRRNEKVYHLSNSTPDFRNAFLKTIRQIIRESVRNMNLPGPEGIASCSSVGTRMKQYPEVISQEREPIRTRQTYREIKEDRSSRGVHYSPHMTSREYKDDHRQIIERNAIDPSVDGDIHSETDSTRDGEFSSGIKSEGEDDTEKHSDMVLAPHQNSCHKPNYFNLTSSGSDLTAATAIRQPHEVTNNTNRFQLVQSLHDLSSNEMRRSSMNDGNAVEIGKHMYGADRKKHNKSDEIERVPESSVSSDLGSPVWKPRDGSK